MSEKVEEFDLRMSNQELEQLILKQAKTLDVRLRLLHKAIRQAVVNPAVIRLLKEGRGFDTIAYQDALFHLGVNINEDTLKTGNIPTTLQDLTRSEVYDVWQEVDEDAGFDDMICIHCSHTILTLTVPFESFVGMKRILGFHQISDNKTIWAGKDITLIIPFEYLVFLDKKHLVGLGPNLKPEWLFYLEPSNTAFYHNISPAPVAGLMVDGVLHGHVVHPSILGDYLDKNPEWKDEKFIELDRQNYGDALAFDSTLALKILKYRYHLPILESQIEKSQQIDNQLYQTMMQHGHVVMEY